MLIKHVANMSRVRARRVRDMIDHDSCQIDSVLQVPLLNRVNCLSQGKWDNYVLPANYCA